MVPENLHYTKDHEWVKIDGQTATIGITDHAQQTLGEITFIELPEVGKKLDAHAELGNAESSKAASDIYAPIAGEVAEINDALESEPELINQDCYGKGWLCKLKVENPDQIKELMTSTAYEEYLKTAD